MQARRELPGAVIFQLFPMSRNAPQILHRLRGIQVVHSGFELLLRFRAIGLGDLPGVLEERFVFGGKEVNLQFISTLRMDDYIGIVTIVIRRKPLALNR